MDNGLQRPLATPTQPRQALLLANPHASRVAQQLPQAIDLLHVAGFDLVVQTPDDPSKLSKLIRQHRDQVDCVIVAGGDGTLNGVADALVETQLPLGVLPLGTANDLARTLGLPVQLEAACEVIAAGNLRRIDLGRVNDKHFFNAASLGLSVQICRQLDKGAKQRWGVLAYPVTTAKSLWQMRPLRVVISDGQNSWQVRTVQLTIGNGRFFGGGMTVDEEAEIDDQQLNLYSIEIEHWSEMPLMFWSLWRGRLERLSKVRTMEGQYFEIKTRRPYWVNTDGELTVRTPATFRSVPLALAVFAPPRPPAAQEQPAVSALPCDAGTPQGDDAQQV